MSVYVGEWLWFGILQCCREGIVIYHCTLFGRFFSFKLRMRRPCPHCARRAAA